MGPTKRRIALLMAVTAGVVLTGCADAGAPQTGPETGPGTGTGEPTVAESGYQLATELGYLPAIGADQLLIVQAADYQRVGELIGLPKPTAPDTSVDELVEWARAATREPGDREGPLATVLPDALGWGQFLTQSDEPQAGLGISFRGVLRFAEVLLLPDAATALQGEFDPAEIEAALGPAEGGVWQFGEEFASDPDQRLVAPPVGAGLTLGEADGDRLLVSRRADSLRAVLAGNGPTLADDEPLTAVAATLDDAGWYSAMLLRAPDFRGDSAAEEALEPFQAVGAAVDVIDGQDVIRLAYAHAEPAAAATNQERVTALLEEGSMIDAAPYTARFTLVDTRVDDSVLLVTLHPQGPASTVWTLLRQRESIVTHH